MSAKDTIVEIQKLIKAWTPDLVVDGDFGKNSRAALEDLVERSKVSTPQSAASGGSTGIPGNIPPQALDIIKHFESCLQPMGDGTYTSYADPGYGWSLPTIGWGAVAYEDGSKVKKGDVISQSRADELLLWEVRQKMDGVKSLVHVPINDNQLSSLTSFSYNVGLGALKDSTLLKKLNAGDYESAADHFMDWVKSNGQTLRGLVRRRQSEKNLFLGKNPYLVT